MTAINPDTVAQPRGYSNGLLLPAGRMLFIAGQIAWDAKANLVEGGFPEQFDQALYNVKTYDLALQVMAGELDHFRAMGLEVVSCTTPSRANSILKVKTLQEAVALEQCRLPQHDTVSVSHSSVT